MQSNVTQLIRQTQEMFNRIKTGKPEVIISNKDIQFIACIDFHSLKSRRYIVIDRTDGTPFFAKYSDGCLYGTVIDWDTYRMIINRIAVLSKAEYGVITDIYHKYSVKDLLKINENTLQAYILPKKEKYPVHNIAAEDDTMFPATVSELDLSNTYFTVIDGKEYRLISYRHGDYVISVEIGKKVRLVDIRDLSDIYVKKYFAFFNGTCFPVDAVGKDSVILRCQNYTEEKQYGFRWLDPHSFGSGWEADISRIDSVKYKKVSVYNRILNETDRKRF